MTVKTVHVGHSRTFNLGNFNSLKLDMSFDVELHDDDDPEQVVRDLQEQAKYHVETEGARLSKVLV